MSMKRALQFCALRRRGSRLRGLSRADGDSVWDQRQAPSTWLAWPVFSFDGRLETRSSMARYGLQTGAHLDRKNPV